MRRILAGMGVWTGLVSGASVGCVSGGSIHTEEFVAICGNATTGTIAVLGESRRQTRVDVYRLVGGTVGEIWPLSRTSELECAVASALRRCRVQLLGSWVVESRIEGLWPIDVAGAVLAAEWRDWGPGGSFLVMRDNNGVVRWEMSAREVFAPVERTEHEWTAHTYEWIEVVAILPRSHEILVIDRGGNMKAIGIDNKVVRGVDQSEAE